MPAIGAIIQARQNSTRFPGKVLKKLHGYPLILRLVEQVSYSNYLDEIIVATSRKESDNALSKACQNNGIQCFRGSLKNVIKRYISAARYFGIEVIIRITGDNPLTDPGLIDDIISIFLNDTDLDYINNVHRNGSVHGSGCELVKLSSLVKSYEMIKSEPKNEDYFEHVTLFIRKHTESFKTRKFFPSGNLKRENISYSVDYPEDLKLARIIFQYLYSKGKPIKTSDVLNLLDRKPELLKLNNSLHQKLPKY